MTLVKYINCEYYDDYTSELLKKSYEQEANLLYPHGKEIKVGYYEKCYQVTRMIKLSDDTVQFFCRRMF